MDTQEDKVAKLCIKIVRFVITSDCESRMRHQQSVESKSTREVWKRIFYFACCIPINRYLSSFKQNLNVIDLMQVVKKIRNSMSCRELYVFINNSDLARGSVLTTWKHKSIFFSQRALLRALVLQNISRKKCSIVKFLSSGSIIVIYLLDNYNTLLHIK